MSENGYLYECHGDYFDAHDDAAAAKDGVRRARQPDTAWCDPVAMRDANILAAHEFDAAVARMEEARNERA